jgi:hypothetical protein
LSMPPLLKIWAVCASSLSFFTAYFFVWHSV